MIKIDKPDSVPPSLCSEKTNTYRAELIAKKKYPNKHTVSDFSVSLNAYNQRYKERDVKTSLKAIYHNKCAFCEQRVEEWQVEHFRPKSIYYWLAYSWDNLLYCCSTCNRNKSNTFPIAKRAAVSDIDLNQIHQLGDAYDAFEKKEFINPEKENVFHLLLFDKKGKISSTDKRIQKTITELKIDRNWLNNRREEVYSEFEQKINSRLYEYNSGDTEAKIKLKGYIEDFIKDSASETKEYLAFRKYIVKHWLGLQAI